MAIKVRWKFTCSVFICIFSACFLKLVNGINLDDKSPSKDFTEHGITKPRIYHGRSKRELSNTYDPDEQGGHTRDLIVSLQLNGVERILDLTINHDLIGGSYFEKTQKNGSYHIHRPTIDELELCHYRGVIRGAPNSWAAISTCSGIKGIVYDGSNTYYIDEGPEYGVNYVYDGRHLRPDKNQSCGFPQTPLVHRVKREIETIRGPYNANRQSRYVELLLVVDNEEYKELKTLPKVYQHCKDIANIINALFVPLNIFIALIGVVVWTEHDEISLTPNGDTTLTHFLHYRREILVKEHPNDNAQLLTRIKFDGGVVGKALKGPICTFEFSGGVSMDHSNVVGLVATTVAHELGHNFGMEHDSSDCQCPDDRCIMAPSSSATSPSHWSSCSLDYLALAFEHGMDYCLRNKPEKLFDSPVCGNGFVEPGEQCDCGLPHRCDNPCCNATSCMLLSNASCATGQCCDFQTCKPKNAGTACRSAEHECDLPEYCTGESEYCPEDVYKIDGESCSRGKAFCYGGKCRTHSDQCQLLWGPSGKNSDIQCYDMNTKGSRHGNCGYNRLNQTYIKCVNENVYCGMVHCSHLNERLEFGMESVSILSHSFINSGGAIIACRTALVDLGLNEVDPGLAPDGAKCGNGKMCVNQKCMSVESLRKDTCPLYCNGNGICNSKGHCHCEDGYAPPLCNYPGYGGSVDSGPASDPNTPKEVTTALYLIFFGVIPLMLLFSFLIYYTRHSVKIWWKTSPARPNNTLWKTKRQSPSGGTSVLLPDSSSVSVGIVDVGIVRQGSPGPKATLLPEDSPRVQVSKPNPPLDLPNDLFGHFKGFSITPLKKPDDFTQISNLKSPEQNHENSSSIMTPSNSVKYEKVDNTLKNNSIILSASNGVKTPTVRTQNSWRNEEGRLRVISPPTLPAVTFRSPKAKPKERTETKPAEDVVDTGMTVPTRPVISEPVLEGTTAKNLISEGTNLVPTRKAPEVPKMEVPDSIAPQAPQKELPPIPNSRPLSSPVDLTDDKNILKDNKEYPALTKIASIMRNASVRRSGSITEKNGKKKPEVKKLKIDREKLKNIEISNPIPQMETEDAPEKKEVTIARAQSMREATPPPKPILQSFGSMRVNGPKRPTSIHVPNRPTSPPPRPPPIKNQEYSYDDCLNLLSEKSAPLAHIDEESTPSPDNIYAVIEESPRSSKKLDTERKVHFSDEKYEIPKSLELPTPKPLETAKPSSGSTESMGLLGEIVTEIQARNLESIYSSGTLKRKKEAKEKENASFAENCDNNLNIYKGAMSDSSTSSNGYLNPNKINSPVNLDFNNSKTTNDVNSVYNDFKKEETPKLTNVESTYKPYSSSLHRGPLSYSYNKDKSEKAPESKPDTPPLMPSATTSSTTGTTNTPSSASPYVKSSFTRPSLLGTPTPPKFTPQSIISSYKKPEEEKKPTPPKSVPNIPTSGNVKRTLSGGKGAVSVVPAVSNSTPKTVVNNQKTNRTAPSPPRKNSLEEAQKPPTRPLPSPPRKTEPTKLPMKSDPSPQNRPLPAVPRKNSKENLAKVNSGLKKPAVSEKKPELGKSIPRKNSNVANLQNKFEGNLNNVEKKKPTPPVAAKPVLAQDAKQS